MIYTLTTLFKVCLIIAAVLFVFVQARNLAAQSNQLRTSSNHLQNAELISSQ